MPLIDNDKEMLYEVSHKHYCESARKKFFPEKNTETYYLETQAKENEYLQEYEFQTPSELKTVLNKFFLEKEIPIECMTPVMVMMLKLKDSTEKKEILMETIYNFW